MRLLFSVPYGLAFRNIVCAGVIDACVDAGGQGMLLLPRASAADAAALAEEIPPSVTVEELLPVEHGPWFTALKALKQHHYGIRTALDSFAIRRLRRRQQRPLVHAAAGALEWVGERVVPEPLIDAAIERARQPHEARYGRVLDSFRPDVVAITKPGYMPEELPLIRASRQRRIKVVSIDTTWDNMASKRPPYLRPDALTVWNGWMAGEATEHYHFPETAVTMTGGTQFDTLFRSERVEARSTFLSRLSLDPGKRLIVFSLNAPLYAPDNPGYLKLLCEGIRSGAIAGAPNLLVRMHPFDRGRSHEEVLAPYPNTRLERPFRLSSPGSAFECLPSRVDVDYYGSLMTHADVLINQASTTSLDAMATDTPVVNIAFDVRPTHPDASIKEVYKYSHYRRIVESKAVTLVDSPDELFSVLSRYLASPEWNRDHRRAALSAFVSHHDAHAVNRVAAVLMDR